MIGEKMLNTIKNFIEFRREKKELEAIVNHAIERDDFELFDKRSKVIVPKNIRRAYFELFKEAVDNKYIVGDFIIPVFLDNKSFIPFYGVSKRKSLFVLEYSPSWVTLEISGYSFNGQRRNPGIKEIGRIQTDTNEDRVSHTNLKVGNTFEYYSGYNTNHDISKIISRIQKSEVIPHISKECILELPRYREYSKVAEYANSQI